MEQNLGHGVVQQGVFPVADIYSPDPKVNSVIRTLLSQYGKESLWKAVADYVISDECDDWTEAEIWELYRATKCAMKF